MTKQRRETRAQALARLRGQADEYAEQLRDKMKLAGNMSMTVARAIDPLITEFARLRVAVAAHLNGEK